MVVSDMELTAEQLERIKKNQQRALEIRKDKETQRSKEYVGELEQVVAVDRSSERHVSSCVEEDDDLEDFEIGASAYITKEQASKLYCLPLESIELCTDVIVKENPKCSMFAAMKLYSRKEIRKKARDRFGGVEALRMERTRRQQKRLKKDMEATINIFENNRNSK